MHRLHGQSQLRTEAIPPLDDPDLRRRSVPIAVEADACPSLTRGTYAYDFGDTVGLTPLVKMHTLGHGFVPPSIHAGGLRYHGAAPLLSQLVAERVVEATAYAQNRVFEAAIQ